MNTNIGKKIRKYRTRAQITQLQLEASTNLSTGSISRIESGVVNPSKETLAKLIDFLDVSPLEAAGLYGVDVDYFANIVNLTHRLSTYKDLKNALQSSCDELLSILNLIGIAVILKEDSQARLVALSVNEISRIALKLSPVTYDAIQFKLEAKNTGIIIQVLKTKTTLTTHSLYELNRPLLPEFIARKIQKITGVHSYIVIPIEEHNSAIGVMVFAKKFKDDFDEELAFLNAFTNTIASTISSFSLKERKKL